MLVFAPPAPLLSGVCVMQQDPLVILGAIELEGLEPVLGLGDWTSLIFGFGT